MDVSLSLHFRHPWKHFPYGDTYLGAGEGAALVTGADKEDDPTGGWTADEEEPDMANLDSQDAADAEALLAQLMSTHPHVQGDVEDKALLEEVPS